MAGYDWVNGPCGWTVKVPWRPGWSYQVLRIDIAEAVTLILTVLGVFLYSGAGQAALVFIATVLVWMTINFVLLR